MGRAAPSGRHGRAEGRYRPKAGKTFSSARGYHHMRARARTDGFGQYLYVCTPMNRSQIVLQGSLWRNCQVCGLVLKGALVEFMPTFLVDPGAGRDSTM